MAIVIFMIQLDDQIDSEVGVLEHPKYTLVERVFHSSD